MLFYIYLWIFELVAYFPTDLLIQILKTIFHKKCNRIIVLATWSHSKLKICCKYFVYFVFALRVPTVFIMITMFSIIYIIYIIYYNIFNCWLYFRISVITSHRIMKMSTEKICNLHNMILFTIYWQTIRTKGAKIRTNAASSFRTVKSFTKYHSLEILL